MPWLAEARKSQCTWMARQDLLAHLRIRSASRSYAGMPEDKTCAACGRRIEWRRKWKDCWDEVKYCSEACRKHKPTAADRALEESILALLSQRASEATLCPSEAARQTFPDGWRDRMEDTRRAARRLVEAAKLEIVQGGRVVDPSTAKGAIRLRLKR